MSGLVTPIGLLTASAAEQYGVGVTVISSQFSWFIGGVFLGYILSFFVFDYLKMKTIIVLVYTLALGCILAIHFIPSYRLLPLLLTVTGICASIGACAGGTLITRLWHGRKRQSVLVAQDAMFNGGGVVFAWLAIALLDRGFRWSSSYMAVGLIGLLVALMCVFSSFAEASQAEDKDQASSSASEWNPAFFLIGFSLLLFLMAKIAIFIWAPQFVEQKFNVGNAESGQFMSNIFSSAFIGSLVGTWLVTKIRVNYLLYSLVVLAMLSTWLFTQSTALDEMLILGFVFGISISATYNSYVAFALTFIGTPTHRHIAYLLLVGGLGSAIGPVLSSKVVEMKGEVAAAMELCLQVYLVVFLVLILAHLCQHFKIGSGAEQPPEKT